MARTSEILDGEDGIDVPMGSSDRPMAHEPTEAGDDPRSTACAWEIFFAIQHPGDSGHRRCSRERLARRAWHPFPPECRRRHHNGHRPPHRSMTVRSGRDDETAP